MRAIWIGPVAALALAGCGQASDVASAPTTTPTAAAAPATPAPATPFTDAWIGKWVGVEGLALTIARGDRAGTYRLHIALMDGANDYIGTAAGDMIRFERNGVAETIRATRGADTGLKWLAEKKDCLTIRAGEGFCRG